MSDSKPTTDGGAKGAIRPDRPPRDKPPLDHVPPGEPPRGHAPPEPDGEAQPRGGGIGEHLSSRDSWLRLLFMVLFVALWWITRLVVLAVVVVQVLFLLLGGKRNARLAGFGASLAAYSYELVAYLTFASEEQPFPFSDWPDGAAPADGAVSKDAG